MRIEWFEKVDFMGGDVTYKGAAIVHNQTSKNLGEGLISAPIEWAEEVDFRKGAMKCYHIDTSVSLRIVGRDVAGEEGQGMTDKKDEDRCDSAEI